MPRGGFPPPKRNPRPAKHKRKKSPPISRAPDDPTKVAKAEKIKAKHNRRMKGVVVERVERKGK
jgi:hypothetical protein